MFDLSKGPPQLDLRALESLAPESRREVEALLAELKRLTDENPLWGYVPTDKQRVYHAIEARFGAFVGGNQSGKTFGGCADDVLQLVDRECLPPWLAGFKVFDEFRGRVIVPGQAESLDVVLPYFRRLIPKSQLYKGEWEKSYDQRQRKLTLANGNYVDFLSHDQNVDRFAGVQRERVRFDEEPPGAKGKAIFNESLARILAVQGGQIRFTMTPLFGFSWTFHLLTRDGVPRWDEECQVVQVSMTDNPHQDAKAREFVLAQYSETERQAREHGRWVHLAGLVYPQFSRDRHMVPVEEIPRDSQGRPTWEFYEGIDPGYGHPMGFVVVAFDQFGFGRVVRSWKMAGRTVADAAARIKRDREELGYRPRMTVIDPSARNKNHATGRSVQMEYTDEGIFTKPGQNSRSAGINRLATWLEREKLLLWATEEELRDEFETHRWKPSRGEDETEPQVIKANDDILDPLRYVLMERPSPAPEHLQEDPRSAIERIFDQSISRLRKPKAQSWGAPSLR